MKKWKWLFPVGTATVLTLGVAMSPAVFAQSQPTVIADSAATGLTQFQNLGAAPSDATMSVLVYLKLQHQSQLQQDIAAHMVMTPAQFHANFSPTSQGYHAVINQLQNAGLTIAGTSDNNMVINVSGTVSQLESVFGTTIDQFQDQNGNTFYANTTDYHVTGALAALLAGASGLDQFASPRPMIQSTSSAATEPLTLNQSSGKKSSSTLPGNLFNGNNSANIQKAYNFGPVYQSGLNGSGETIAIVDANGNPNIQSNLQTYNQTVEQGAYGANIPLDLTVETPPGMTQVATTNPVQGVNAADWGGEVSMDVELSHAAAPGAHILLVETPNAYNDLYMGVNQVINGHLADQMSLSFGSPEAAVPLSEQGAVNQMFEQAAAEGINVFVSAGDWGDWTPFIGYKDVSFPASDPYVVSVGGSSLFVDNKNNYQSEMEWGDTFTQILSPSGQLLASNLFWAGTGGGTSNFFAKPSWQTGVSGLGSTNMRQVPDVGYNSDPFTGFELVMPDGSIQDGWGGTSDAAPQWAAIAALANQGHKQLTGGSALPFIDPILYQNGQTAFHDVVHGTYTLQFTGSSSGDQYTMAMGEDTSLKATPGWDNTTGLGTPDVAKIVSELENAN